jgi:hypothetical protein
LPLVAVESLVQPGQWLMLHLKGLGIIQCCKAFGDNIKQA